VAGGRGRHDRAGFLGGGRQAYRDFYEKGLELTGAAHRAGVRILAGTDYIVPGADLHRELVNLVSAGLSPAEALKTATLNPALYFGVEREYGSVDAGRVADLLLLAADPLQDIHNTQRIAAVVFKGNLYDRETLDGLQRQARGRARSWTVACKILWRFVRNPSATEHQGRAHHPPERSAVSGSMRATRRAGR
jgi:hypothetical protein